MSGSSFTIRCDSPGYSPRMQRSGSEELTQTCSTASTLYFLERSEEDSISAELSQHIDCQEDTSSIEADVFALAAKVQSLADFQGLSFSSEESGEKILLSEDRSASFPASCLPHSNTILWNKRFFEEHHIDLYSQVFFLIFERLNLRCQKEFDELVTLAKDKSISKESYVRGVEKIEHQNALKAQAMLINGLKAGLFQAPVENPYKIFDDFSTHYKFQQLMGHSQRIAERYDILTDTRRPIPFVGTFPTANQTMTEKQHNTIHGLFSLKRKMKEDGEAGTSASLILGCNIVFLEAYKKSDALIEIKAIHSIFSKSELEKLRAIGRQFLFARAS